ncbi:MAG: glucosamine-6-phosphate deaminase [Prolixibacteraceae bacterium]|nr:glucosamine-6-phosphate deaminase [Prolixibacteraceae bacterium]
MKKEFCIDQLHVCAFDSRMEMGKYAALKATAEIISMLRSKTNLNIIFAAAPSQDEFLKELIRQPEIDWTRINAFHMDEYIGLPADAPQSFGNYLKVRVFDKVPFRTVSYIGGIGLSPEETCTRYANLLNEFPPDIVFMGIGENGHIAFNDPHVADFDDKATIKIVDLDLVCRQQQVNDGCFSKLGQVPEQAITLTIPLLMGASRIFCIVPGKTKAQAVFNTINKDIIEEYPSTILRTHPSADLFLDNESSVMVRNSFEKKSLIN